MAADSHGNDEFVSNKDNWMMLPHPDSAVLSHRMLNSVRLFDISGSAEGMRGMLIQAAKEVEQLERELAEVRAALAGEDYASLPSDFPTVRMAHDIRSERDKFFWQVRDTCARAEKAEAALSEIEFMRKALDTCRRTLPHMEGRSAHGLLQVVEEALKKTDPQGVPSLSAGAATPGESQPSPAASAPCVAVPSEIVAAIASNVMEQPMMYGAYTVSLAEEILRLAAGNHERKGP